MTDSAFRSRASKRWGAFMDFANQHSGAEWMFRGVGDRQQHLLVPKIGRPAPPDLPGAKPVDYTPTRERAIFKTFKRRAGLHLDRMPDNDFGWLALAQHRGLPTRLLDRSERGIEVKEARIEGVDVT